MDILKAKTTVQNTEFRRGETAEGRMAGRYTHGNCGTFITRAYIWQGTSNTVYFSPTPTMLLLHF